MANIFDAAADAQWITRSAFRGAEYNRLYSDRWNAVNRADTEIQYAAKTLRARARDLVRNNPYATGVVEAIADNLVGWEGIRLKPKIALPSGDPNRGVNWEIERGWKDWADEYATVDGVESWFETERLIVKSWVTDGEMFLRRRRGWDNPYGYATELIDPDMLDEDFNETRERNGREIIMGVEVDEYGRPLAYHFWKHHPDAMLGQDRVRIPASDIVHLFARYRAGQTRGFSWFAPALTRVEMIDGYEEAELVAARYHASKMGFITNNTPEAIAAYATRLTLQNQRGEKETPRRVKIGPGVVEELIPGQGFESFDPTHPTDAFDKFLGAMFRGVAKGFGVSAMTVTGDLTGANYSSMRAGLLPERDHAKALQSVLSRRVHNRVYRDWIGMSLLTGSLNLRSVRASDFYAVEWRGRRWQWVDPENDLTAAEREVKLGLNSRQRLAADRGNDFEVIVDESADDMAYAKAAQVYVGGVDTPPASRAPAPSTNGNGTKPAGRALFEEV